MSLFTTLVSSENRSITAINLPSELILTLKNFRCLLGTKWCMLLYNSGIQLVRKGISPLGQHSTAALKPASLLVTSRTMRVLTTCRIGRIISLKSVCLRTRTTFRFSSLATRRISSRNAKCKRAKWKNGVKLTKTFPIRKLQRSIVSVSKMPSMGSHRDCLKRQ